MGFVIGVVVAESHLQALEGARLVKVEYKDLPHVITIEVWFKYKHEDHRKLINYLQDAIEKNSYLNMHHVIKRGDVSVGFSESDHIIEGSMKVGGQEHFYLETNTTLAVPGEDGEMQV